MDDDELAVKILSGLGSEYREITTAIRAQDTALSFEELFQKLTDHEIFLKHQDIYRSSSSRLQLHKGQTFNPISEE